MSPLAPFLIHIIHRACRSAAVANSFYWFLKVETQDKQYGSLFELVMEPFVLQLSTAYGSQGSLLGKQIMALDDYIANIAKCRADAKRLGSDKDVKERELKRLLAERGHLSMPPPPSLLQRYRYLRLLHPRGGGG